LKSMTCEAKKFNKVFFRVNKNTKYFFSRQRTAIFHYFAPTN